MVPLSQLAWNYRREDDMSSMKRQKTVSGHWRRGRLSDKPVGRCGLVTHAGG